MMRKWKELQWPECFPHDIFTGMGYYECNICGEKIEMPPIEQAAKNYDIKDGSLPLYLLILGMGIISLVVAIWGVSSHF